MLSPSRSHIYTTWSLKILCTSLAGMGSEASETLMLPWVGGADATEETGCNEEKGNGWSQMDGVDIGQ